MRRNLFYRTQFNKFHAICKEKFQKCDYRFGNTFTFCTDNLFVVHYICVNWHDKCDFFYLFSSPGPKGRVSFCHHFASVVVSVNFSYLHLLLWNHWTDLDQTWQKCSLGGPLPDLLFWCRSEIQHGCQGQ